MEISFLNQMNMRKIYKRKCKIKLMRILEYSLQLSFERQKNYDKSCVNALFQSKKIIEASTSCKGECLHVALLSASPAIADSEKYLSFTNTKELAVIQERDVYLLFYDSIRNSKIGSKLDILGIPATVRNWKTLSKLIQMIEEFY